MDLLSESIKGRLLFAIPKKGRLNERCLELLAGADIKFFRSHRLDVCLVQNHPIALVFLNASDIPRFVGEGNVDLGITGQDRIYEAQMESNIKEILPLGFGKCKLQIQVPEHGPIQTVEGLVGKRVATSFEHVAGKHFRGLDARLAEENPNANTTPTKTKIEYVGGSVEAACALGLADGIVDLVESGETMRAAGLHPIATLLTTEAVLISSNTPPKDPSFEPLISRITKRIAGVIASSKFVLCTYNVPKSKLPEAKAVTPGRRAPTVSPLQNGGEWEWDAEGGEWVAVSVLIESGKIADVMDDLASIGAEDILVTKLENCRV